MAEPYFSKDESVILATDNMIFRSVSLPALVLTNKRILLIQIDGEDLSAEEIPLSKLRSAEVDEHAVTDPVLSLSYVTDNGEIRQETLRFLQQHGKQRKEECREWAKKLSEQIVPSFGEGTLFRRPLSPKEPVKEPAAGPVSPVGTVPPARATVGKSAKSPGAVSTPMAASSPREFLAKHDRPTGLAFPSLPRFSESELPESPAPAPRRKFVAVAALVLVILAVIAIAFVSLQYLQQKPALPTGPAAPAPTIPAIITTVPTPVPMTPSPTTPPETPVETVSPMPSSPQVLIPQTGVWVRVQYPGNFTGLIGEGGNFRPVTGTGDRFYQMATKTGIVKAIIQKLDGSGDLLTVDIYQNGALIPGGTTTTPEGEVNIQIELKAASPTVTVMPNVTVTNVTMQKP